MQKLIITTGKDEDMVLATEAVVRMLTQGYTSGVNPDWELTDEN